MQKWPLAIQGSIYGLIVFMVLVGLVSPVTDCVAANVEFSLKTRHTILAFSDASDVATFNDAIDYGERTSLLSIFKSSASQTAEKELARKVDLLFKKVQLILDMRKDMRRVRVRVFSNKEQLHRAYEKIYKRKCSVRGWYVYEFNTVFLNVKDVHEGMLAHELGHAIIDHFLSVRPPRATAEILAKYVDKHLHEEVRKY